MPEPENSANIGAFFRAVKDHWLTLMSGGIITVLLGVFERFSGKNVPLWVYAGILIFFAFLACYLAWRDAQKKLISLSGKGAFKREFLAGRLKTLLHDAEEAMKEDAAKSIHLSTILGSFIPLRNHRQIQLFIERYYDADTLERFNQGGLHVVEKLLADCYRDDETNRSTKSVDSKD